MFLPHHREGGAHVGGDEAFDFHGWWPGMVIGDWGIETAWRSLWNPPYRFALLLLVLVMTALSNSESLWRFPIPYSPIPHPQLMVPTSFNRLSSGTSL